MSDSVRPHRRQPIRLPRPWDSPGKNTGVGCHFLLQWMKVRSESEVAQSCPTLSDPMACSLPGSSVHGIFQARVLEWGAIAFSRKHPNVFWIKKKKKKLDVRILTPVRTLHAFLYRRKTCATNAPTALRGDWLSIRVTLHQDHIKGEVMSKRSSWNLDRSTHHLPTMLWRSRRSHLLPPPSLSCIPDLTF